MPPPGSHTVAILIDGSAMEYLDAASAAGCMPHFNRLLNRTTYTPTPPPSQPASTHKYTPYFHTAPPTTSAPTAGTAQLYRVSGVMPSYTNPNNVSVITGVPPRVHGLAGNYYYDRTTQREVMMNDPSMIRCPTILHAAQQAGADITVVTVKDKLRRLLTKDLPAADLQREGAGRHVSIEKLDDRSLPGMELSGVIRDVYEPMCSISALQLGVQLIERNITVSNSTNSPPHIYYFTTTDYVQHKAPPGHPLANEFYAGLDNILGQLSQLPSPSPIRFAFTADHGMSAKARHDGSPRVVYLADVLEAEYPNGAGHEQWRVILPITDPHPRHHGALGGYATVYLTQPTPAMLADVCGLLRRQRGVYTAMGAAEAAVALELPLDRIGDIVVIADRDWAVGKGAADHADSLREMEADLRKAAASEGGAGAGGLRSHGGLDEMLVPLFISSDAEMDAGRRKRLMQGKGRNYDMFDVLLKSVAAAAGGATQQRK